MSLNVVFITGNQNKLSEVKKILGSQFNVINYDIDLPEIQTTEVKEVINEKLNEAKKILNEQEHLNNIAKKFMDIGINNIKSLNDIIIFCEDTGFYIDTLSPNDTRFPGALIKFYFKALKNKGIIQRDKNSKATIECYIGMLINGKTMFIEGKVEGKIPEDYKGEVGFGFDASFIPNLPNSTEYDNYKNKTYAELDIDIKNKISHRAIAFNKLKTFLLTQAGGNTSIHKRNSKSNGSKKNKSKKTSKNKLKNASKNKSKSTKNTKNIKNIKSKKTSKNKSKKTSKNKSKSTKNTNNIKKMVK